MPVSPVRARAVCVDAPPISDARRDAHHRWHGIVPPLRHWRHKACATARTDFGAPMRMAMSV